MCRVKSFLGCASLKSFGTVYGWINLVIQIVAAIIIGVGFIVSVYKRHGQYALIFLLVFAFVAFNIFITHQFIEGIKKHNHNQMSVFRFFAILAAVVAPIQLIVKIFTLGQYSRHQVQRDPTEGLIISIFTCILAIYFGCCVNSLYLQIEEAKLPVTVASQAQVRPTHNDKSLS